MLVASPKIDTVLRFALALVVFTVGHSVRAITYTKIPHFDEWSRITRSDES